MVDTKYVMCYNESLLAQFWKKAEAISHRGKNILLVFDDCIGSVNWKAPKVEEVFSNHRHNHVSILVAMQHQPEHCPWCSTLRLWLLSSYLLGTAQVDGWCEGPQLLWRSV
jgi:hypothetical protein